LDIFVDAEETLWDCHIKWNKEDILSTPRCCM